jgi:hypothetical protein
VLRNLAISLICSHRANTIVHRKSSLIWNDVVSKGIFKHTEHHIAYGERRKPSYAPTVRLLLCSPLFLLTSLSSELVSLVPLPFGRDIQGIADDEDVRHSESDISSY